MFLTIDEKIWKKVKIQSVKTNQKVTITKKGPHLVSRNIPLYNVRFNDGDESLILYLITE
ncbi:MAG: hypothetical protein ACXWFC_13835 [Nitrososphaeraceae archaeon]